MVVVQREITGYRQDELGDWIARLVCHHARHVRHRPPLMPLPWVETPQGRTDHIGTTIECPLCDRGELPDGLEITRTAGPFDETTLPAALRRNHRVAAGTWGVLRVLTGTARFTMDTVPPFAVELDAGDSQVIPPGVPHAVGLDTGTIEVDFLIPVNRR